MPRRRIGRKIFHRTIFTYDEFYMPFKKTNVSSIESKQSAAVVSKGKAIAVRASPLVFKIVEIVRAEADRRGSSWMTILMRLKQDKCPASRTQRLVALRRALSGNFLRRHVRYPNRFCVGQAIRKQSSASKASSKSTAQKKITNITSGMTTIKKKSTPKMQKKISKPSDVGGIWNRHSFSANLVNAAENIDKWYEAQLNKTAEHGFEVTLRWGRTGDSRTGAVNPGRVEIKKFADADSAETFFRNKYHEKTGNVWGIPFVPQRGKYQVMNQACDSNSDKGSWKWQYYVDDGVDGKRLDWYDYTPEASCIVEGIYMERLHNPGCALEVRTVQSGSFCYRVDFAAMRQTNLTHAAHRQRPIRRVPM